MSAYMNLKNLLIKMIEWEEKFTDFYNYALGVIEEKHCKQTITILLEKQMNNLQILRNIDIDNYGSNEWIMITPDINTTELLSKEKISSKSNTEDIAKIILNLEQKIQKFYLSVSKKIIDTGQRDLFDSLVIFKEKQIYEIKRCLEKW